MNSDEKYRFLNCQRLPARLSIQQTSALLGVADHDIPILVRKGILKPLGAPAPNAPKYFSAVSVEELCRIDEAMHKVSKALTAHWKNLNLGRNRLPSSTRANRDQLAMAE